MDLKGSMTSRLICNIGHNKMEQQTPIPPKSRMKPREGQKCAIFPSLILGGGSMVSIYFVQECGSRRERVKVVFGLGQMGQFVVTSNIRGK